MPIVERWRIAWSGSAVVGGGVSTHFFETPVSSISTDVGNFYKECLKYCPPSVTVTIPSSGDLIDTADGSITGTWTHGGVQTWPGTAASNFYAGGVGARIVWNTLGRKNNRRIKGSTFIVPLAASMYDTDGTLLAAPATDLKFRGDTLVTAQTGSMGIWSRPEAGAGGLFNSIVDCNSPDKVSWLRSRRT